MHLTRRGLKTFQQTLHPALVELELNGELFFERQAAVFIRKGRLLSSATLFDDAFEEACTAAGLVDTNGTRTVSAHRLGHTLGTQLAEGGARIQTLMTILGHKGAAMSMIYSRISDREVRRQYEATLPYG